MKKQYRHGDVLIEEAQITTQGLVKSKNNKVALGEATGHAHQLGDSAILYMNLEHPTFGAAIEIPVDTPLSHEEHKTIVLPPATYKVTHQRTFSKVGINKVLD